MSTISALVNALPIIPPPSSLSPTVNNPKMNNSSSTPSNPNASSSSTPNNASGTNTPNANPSQTNNSTNSSAIIVEEKIYKKEKHILLEFDSKTKGKSNSIFVDVFVFKEKEFDKKCFNSNTKKRD